jgi:hypothetical protein
VLVAQLILPWTLATTARERTSDAYTGAASLIRDGFTVFAAQLEGRDEREEREVGGWVGGWVYAAREVGNMVALFLHVN